MYTESVPQIHIDFAGCPGGVKPIKSFY
jgi:hypothetical protein